jgi:hypothetical protein
MAGRTTRKTKEKVQIDADWLLGESDDRSTRGSSWFWSFVTLLVVITSAVWSWPYASKQWLQWEWQRELSQSSNKSSEDVLPLLLALNDLNPKHNEPIVQQLGCPDAEKRLLAFHLLQKKIESWGPANPPTPSELTAFANDLQSMASQQPESVMMRGQLAARMLRHIGTETPNASRLRASLESMIANAGNVSNEATSRTAPISTASARLSDNATTTNRSIGDSPVTRARVISDTRVRLGDGDSSELASTPEPPTISRISDASFTSSTDDAGPVAPIEHTPAELLSSVAIVKPALPIPNPSVPIVPSVRMTDMSSAKPAPNLPATALAPPPLTPTTDDRVEPTIVSIQGIDKSTFEQLLNLLSSTQPRLVQQASDELLRRGMTSGQLEMALRLAQGDVSDRLMEMERLVRDKTINPIRLLVWLAENSDRKVRHKAVALLGSMSNDEALRSLRMLKMREADSVIADQINQVLLAAGSSVDSRR